MPTDPTPIPAEAIEAAHRAAVATWHVMATTGHRQAVEAAVRAAAPILLAAGCTAADVLAENERLRVDLAHWMSGRRTRGIPPPATVPDGLTYAAQLVRAQGTEGGEDHDRLLREASMRLKALHDLASRQQDELVWLRQDRDAAHAAGRTAAAADPTITNLAIAYVNAPDGSDDIPQIYHELQEAVRQMESVNRAAARIAENGADHA